jgi:hypothetical protein
MGLMRVEIGKLESGWYEISIGLNEEDIDLLIKRLRLLKDNKSQHFHIMSDYVNEKGVGDIEIYSQGEAESNMVISGGAIEPND